MNILKLLLYPFATIYNGVMRLRNHLYDIGQKPSFEFQTAVIAVGNLNVGGSGKTPMVEYLAALLADRFPTITLSRGYKRETTGYRIAGQEDTARTIGDEPLQLFRKFGSKIHVAVGEDRVYAIPLILMEFPETRVLILDDAMQHRSISPHLTILLTSFQRPFFSDFLLPFGRLREARSGAGRADAVVITKCPHELSHEEQFRMKEKVQRYAGDKPVFFSTVAYGDPVPARPGYTMADTIILVTGIANADPLLEFCSARFRVVRHFRFADHHRYSQADMEEIERSCQSFPETLSVLTTEKDMAKLDCPEYAQYMDQRPWFSMPIRQVFIQDGSKFDALVVDAVEHAPQP